MKQSAAKTLGVAVLGAAFAATAAGSASAVGALPVNTPLETVGKAMPAAVPQLPGGAADALTTAQGLLAPVTEGAALQAAPIDPATATDLLGGLPIGGGIPGLGV